MSEAQTFFPKLIPKNSIPLRSAVDKFRTISTASSLVNINALLYKLVERLPIAYHRVKMQRLKYNWQSFNLSLISHFDIFSLITFLLQSTPLHFASHYRKYLSTVILVRFAIVSKRKKKLHRHGVWLSRKRKIINFLVESISSRITFGRQKFSKLLDFW